MPRGDGTCLETMMDEEVTESREIPIIDISTSPILLPHMDSSNQTSNTLGSINCTEALEQ